MKIYMTLFLLFNLLYAHGQLKKVEVLTLGVFHFDFPNLDERKIEKADQIDVLEPNHQKEINGMVEKLSKFKPTIIVIERNPRHQPKIDSLYKLYLQDKFALERDEDQQIGFRLAKRLGISKLYCVDEWGDFMPFVNSVLEDTLEMEKFIRYVEQNPDRPKKMNRNYVFKTRGILEQIRKLNESEYIKQSLGDYLMGPFKYEINDRDFFGTNFETGRWFSRNLKIFRNIQRIETSPEDRILVIFGADHLNLLNIFFESSPEYKLVQTNRYLK